MGKEEAEGAEDNVGGQLVERHRAEGAGGEVDEAVVVVVGGRRAGDEMHGGGSEPAGHQRAPTGGGRSPAGHHRREEVIRGRLPMPPSLSLRPPSRGTLGIVAGYSDKPRRGGGA